MQTCPNSSGMFWKKNCKKVYGWEELKSGIVMICILYGVAQGNDRDALRERVFAREAILHVINQKLMQDCNLCVIFEFLVRILGFRKMGV